MSKKRYHTMLGVDVHCVVCGRVQFGQVQALPFGHWRHSDCKPGSVNWMNAYVVKPKSQHTEEGNLFLTWAKDGRP